MEHSGYTPTRLDGDPADDWAVWASNPESLIYPCTKDAREIETELSLWSLLNPRVILAGQMDY